VSTKLQERIEKTAPKHMYDELLDAAAAETVDEHRAAVVAGLRELAGFLEAHPDVPVDRYGIRCVSSLGEGDGDEAAVGRVEAMAAALGVEARHHPPGYWGAQRRFGPVLYGGSYVARDEMAAHEAAQSYKGSVEPAGGTAR